MAREAYIYAYAPIWSYNTWYKQSVDKSAHEYNGGFIHSGTTHRPSRLSPPSAGQVDMVMNAYSSEVATMRASELTQALSANKVEQLFTLGFALDQLRNDLTDLERCVREWKTV